VSPISLKRKASFTFASAVLNCSLAVVVKFRAVFGSVSEAPRALIRSDFESVPFEEWMGLAPILAMVF